ncbi:MAG: galactokinase, partial [Ruminococcus sp.]|nr:galactokinase [Ruminococcus sp.]
QMKDFYGCDEMTVMRNKSRYINAAEHFSRLYPECSEIRVFSAPGRTEVGGNHTDHQHGCILAAAVDLDVIAIAALNGEDVIRIKSEGYPADEVSLSELEKKPEEEGTSAALIRGIAAKFAENGVSLKGINVYTTSEVISGSGLSSSAAFENLVGTMLDRMFASGSIGAVEIAKIGQYAENVYFGKASGLMDQMVSSVGGFVYIDFACPDAPIINKVDFDFSGAGYALCITDTKGSHGDLTADYVAVPEEMKQVAKVLGGDVLRDCDEEEFYQKLPEIREKCSDRALLRAAHFFAENRRAADEAEALKAGDLIEFFRLVNESGRSSADLLQNLYSVSRPNDQAIPLAIMVSRRILGDDGAVRVHGGGFAGTIQAFVPAYLAKDYAGELDRIFGAGSCHVLTVRNAGGAELFL